MLIADIESGIEFEEEEVEGVQHWFCSTEEGDNCVYTPVKDIDHPTQTLIKGKIEEVKRCLKELSTLMMGTVAA